MLDRGPLAFSGAEADEPNDPSIFKNEVGVKEERIEMNY